VKCNGVEFDTIGEQNHRSEDAIGEACSLGGRSLSFIFEKVWQALETHNLRRRRKGGGVSMEHELHKSKLGGEDTIQYSHLNPFDVSKRHHPIDHRVNSTRPREVDIIDISRLGRSQ
jgi:hypothetical protein